MMAASVIGRAVTAAAGAAGREMTRGLLSPLSAPPAAALASPAPRPADDVLPELRLEAKPDAREDQRPAPTRPAQVPALVSLATMRDPHAEPESLSAKLPWYTIPAVVVLACVGGYFFLRGFFDPRVMLARAARDDAPHPPVMRGKKPKPLKRPEPTGDDDGCVMHRGRLLCPVDET